MFHQLWGGFGHPRVAGNLFSPFSLVVNLLVWCDFVMFVRMCNEFGCWGVHLGSPRVAFHLFSSFPLQLKLLDGSDGVLFVSVWLVDGGI